MATPLLPAHQNNLMSPSGLSVWFAPLKEDGTLCPPTDLGCVRDISLSLQETELVHKCSRYGLQQDNHRVISEVMGDVNVTIDELVADNLIYALRPNAVPNGSATYVVHQSKTFRVTASGMDIVIDAKAKEAGSDDYADIFWDDESSADVLVTTLDGTTTYAESTDYTFVQAVHTPSSEAPAKITHIASGSGGTIAVGSQIKVQYRYRRDATSYVLQSGAVLEGELRIQALNAIGPQCAWVFGRASLGISGDLALNPGEYLGMQLTFKILPDGDGSRGHFYLFDTYERNTALQCS